MVQEEEKVPPKKYAIKPPRDLTSRFQQEQETKKLEEIKAEEERRLREEEERLLVGLRPQPLHSVLRERPLATVNRHRSAHRGPHPLLPPHHPPHQSSHVGSSHWWSASFCHEFLMSESSAAWSQPFCAGLWCPPCSGLFPYLYILLIHPPWFPIIPGLDPPIHPPGSPSMHPCIHTLISRPPPTLFLPPSHPSLPYSIC